MWEVVRQVHRSVGHLLSKLTDITGRTRLVSAYWGETASFSYSYFLCFSLFLRLSSWIIDIWVTCICVKVPLTYRPESNRTQPRCLWFKSSCNCSPSPTSAIIRSCWLIYLPHFLQSRLGSQSDAMAIQSIRNVRGNSFCVDCDAPSK